MVLTTFEVATFDCYGTLIDWESGILNAVQPVLSAHGLGVQDAALLEAYAQIESSLQRGPWVPYADVLREVIDGLGHRFGFRPSAAERDALAGSIRDWPAFPDTAAALDALRRRYRLIVVSNIDDELFAGTARHLGVPLDDVVTAQRVRSYKPARGHFEAVCERTKLPAARVLHVAQSLYHDIAPAKAMGFGTVWVNRRGRKQGTGATPPADAAPDLEVPDLAALAARVEAAFSSAAGNASRR